MTPTQMTHDKPELNPWLIALAVMLAMFMEVLNTSIAAVALPYIAGSLPASNDEARWMLTSVGGISHIARKHEHREKAALPVR